MPYDAGWRRPGPGPRQGYDRGWGPGGEGHRRGFRYDGDFRPETGWGGGRPAAGNGGGGTAGVREWEDELVYGPARYGLGPYHDRLRKRTRPDAEIKHDVEEALFYDTWVDAEAITVEVKDGIVTLRGELPDFDEVRYATDDAWDVDGVRGVRTELSVSAGRPKPKDGLGFGPQHAGGAGGIGTA